MKREERENLKKNEQKFMEEIGAALKRHEKKTKLDAEVLEGWVTAAKEKSRARKRKYMTAISCVVIVCAGTFSAMNLLVPDAAIAGKNGPITTEEGNNTIVKEGRGEPGENAGKESIIVDDWKKVDGVKKKYPQLLIPQYVPEGYEFSELAVEASGLFNTYTYIFVQNEERFQLTQTVGTELEIIKDYDRAFKTDEGVEVRFKDDIEASIHFIIGKDLCTLIGSFSDEEYGRIVDALER